MPELQSEHLVSLSAELGSAQRLGETPRGRRVIWPVISGRFGGPALSGTVLPGGADWLLVRSDGAFELDVRITLNTHDEHLIFMSHRGIIKVEPEFVENFVRGEAVDPSRVYFRAAPVFEAGPGPYEWLNRIVSVGIGSRLANTITWEIFQIL